MAGPPPFGGRQVTLANWQRPPFNRWSFQHVRELIPTARIARGDGPAWELPRAEQDGLGQLRFGDARIAQRIEPFARRLSPGRLKCCSSPP